MPGTARRICILPVTTNTSSSTYYLSICSPRASSSAPKTSRGEGTRDGSAADYRNPSPLPIPPSSVNSSPNCLSSSFPHPQQLISPPSQPIGGWLAPFAPAGMVDGSLPGLAEKAAATLIYGRRPKAPRLTEPTNLGWQCPAGVCPLPCCALPTTQNPMAAHHSSAAAAAASPVRPALRPIHFLSLAVLLLSSPPLPPPPSIGWQWPMNYYYWLLWDGVGLTDKFAIPHPANSFGNC